MALIAAAPVAAHPAPLSSVAAKSCHGSRARAQPSAPSAAAIPPARVTATRPKRRCRAGKFATAAAPRRKWQVTAAETSATGHPRCSCTAYRKTGGP